MAHHGHGFALRCVAVSEGATAKETNSHRLEVSGSDGEKVGQEIEILLGRSLTLHRVGEIPALLDLQRAHQDTSHSHDIGESSHPIEHAIEKHPSLRGFLTEDVAAWELHGVDVLLVKTDFDAIHRQESADEHRGANQENQGKGNLHHHNQI